MALSVAGSSLSPMTKRRTCRSESLVVVRNGSGEYFDGYIDVVWGGRCSQHGVLEQVNGHIGDTLWVLPHVPVAVLGIVECGMADA